MLYLCINLYYILTIDLICIYVLVTDYEDIEYCVKLVVSFHYIVDDNKQHRLDDVRYGLVAMANFESGWASQRRKETCMQKEQVVSIFVYTIRPMDILLHQLRWYSSSKSTGAGLCPWPVDMNNYIQIYQGPTETRRTLQICKKRNKRKTEPGTKHPLGFWPQPIYEFYESWKHFGEIKLGFQEFYEYCVVPRWFFEWIYEAYT